MTFPTAVARTPTTEGSAGFSHPISLGSPSAGDLLVVFASSGSTFYLNKTASGRAWFQVGGGNGASSLRVAVFAKIAEGGGNDGLTLETTISNRVAALCYRITGHSSAIAASSFATAVGTNGNPTSAAISGSAQDVLFLAFLATTSSVASAAPTNYGTLTTANSGTTAAVNVAERNLNGTSDDPGTFTNTSQEWGAVTIAIPELSITTNARATQTVAETLSNVAPAMYGSQLAVEVMSSNALYMISSQLVVEMLSQNVPDDTIGSVNKYRQIQIAC